MTHTRPVLCEVMLLGSGSARLTKVGSGDRELAYYQRIDGTWDVWLFEYDALEPSWAAAGLRAWPITSANRLIQSTVGAFRAARRGPVPTVIRSKQWLGAWSGLIFKWVTGRPLIIRMGYHWSHNVIVERHIGSRLVRAALRGAERWLVHRADGVIFGSEILRRAFPTVRVPSVVVPNGIDETLFGVRDVPARFDLIYVGRAIAVKGFDRLAALLPPDLSICVVGAGPMASLLDGRPGVTRYERLANSDLPNLLCQARCFMAMSRTEGSPKALLEAMCCGLYPILSDIPPHRAIVEQAGYGTLLNDSATQDDVRAAVHAASVPPDRLAGFRRAYSMAGIVDAELAFLDLIAGERPSV